MAPISPSKVAVFPKKPNNSFFLYRKDMKDKIAKEHGVSKSHEISKIAGIMWKSESEEVKEYYNSLGKVEFSKHKQDHPDYIWPSRTHSTKPKKSESRKKKQLSPISPLSDTYSEFPIYYSTPILPYSDLYDYSPVSLYDGHPSLAFDYTERHPSFDYGQISSNGTFDHILTPLQSPSTPLSTQSPTLNYFYSSSL